MAKTRLSSKFNKCVKSVRRTVRARKGSTKESAAIAICTKSVLQKRGRTIKKYRKGRLTTQKKFRGGADPQPEPAGQGFGLFRTSTRESVPPPPSTWESISNDMETTIDAFGQYDNRMTDLAQKVHGEILNVQTPMTESDKEFVNNIFSFALEAESKDIIKALYSKGVGKDYMSNIIEKILERDITPDLRRKLVNFQPFVANLS